MRFGLMFFGNHSGESRPYELLLDAASVADSVGLSAVWTPERHFHPFGGLYPNPAVTGAALAARTKSVRIRAGSLISPLHDVLRVVEEFAVVDNISDGRVDVSFAPGWHPNDFVLNQEAFHDRRQINIEFVRQARALWRGDSLQRVNGIGNQVEVRIYPTPKQVELPVWLTAAASKETFATAGDIGANVLTHLVGQTKDTLAENVAAYRAARHAHGHDSGVVTVMLHTYVHSNVEEVVRATRTPFIDYLKSWVSLEQSEIGSRAEASHIPSTSDELLEVAFQDYLASRSLMGTPAECHGRIRELEALGVDEIACLVDFGLRHGDVLAGIHEISKLQTESE